MRMIKLQEQIGRGKYHVDTQAVADAIVRRLLQAQKIARSEQKRAQEECS
jgi:hypothetical protein